MQLRYVKDFAILLIVIIFLILGVRLYTNHHKANRIPAESVYTKESVSDDLITKIKGIESSIQDRKRFVFTINRDPLRQGNIIKDRLDLEREFMERLHNTFRLSSTAILENGKKSATIEFREVNYYAEIGSNIEGRIIRDIGSDWIKYYYNGSVHTTYVQARPPMPDFSQAETDPRIRHGNF
ncbi:MAG: hypothetical protein GX122_04010 [Candidatus Cloacimonetes bacterium]|nr:hypothetical protein [Candidatus Cloacimonadota bacterium]NLO11570.1 hypothetical protein [Candidatus Cloacimonadota bacterium]